MEATLTRRNGSVHTLRYDAEDADLVHAHTWHVHEVASGAYYAATNVREGERRRTVYLHRLLTGLADVDHVNGDGLDNRRANLRAATRSQQCANQGARRGSSRFKGVCKRRSKWEASICVDRRNRYLGTFDTEVEAALAYDVAAYAAWGDFARLNF